MAELIRINKAADGDIYHKIDAEQLGKAAGCLKLSGLRLYLYLGCNEDGFHWDMRSGAYANWLGMPYSRNIRKIVVDGIEDLIANGYMRHVKDNIFEFFEEPLEKPKIDDLGTISSKIDEKLGSKDKKSSSEELTVPKSTKNTFWDSF